MGEDKGRVERVVILPARPDDVWEVLVDPSHLGEWFGGRLDVYPVPGGDVIYTGDDGERRRGVVVVAHRPERLTFWWWPEGVGSEAPGTRVEFRLAEAAEGTVLSVTEEEGEPMPLPPRASIGFSARRRLSAVGPR